MRNNITKMLYEKIIEKHKHFNSNSSFKDIFYDIFAETSIFVIRSVVRFQVINDLIINI